MAETAGTEEKEPWQVKEAIVVVPLLASALAITYDVGYFYGLDIKLFSLFSLSEHVVFALEALPFAFLLAATLAFVFSTGLSERIIERAERRSLKRYRRELVLIIIGLTLLAAVAFYLGFSILSFFVGLVAGIIWRWTRDAAPSREKTALAGSALCLLTAFSTGFDFSRNNLRFGSARHFIEINKETLNVKIIRSGDRGLLFFDPTKKELLFVRWEAVTKIGETR